MQVFRGADAELMSFFGPFTADSEELMLMQQSTPNEIVLMYIHT